MSSSAVCSPASFSSRRYLPNPRNGENRVEHAENTVRVAAGVWQACETWVDMKPGQLGAVLVHRLRISSHIFAFRLSTGGCQRYIASRTSGRLSTWNSGHAVNSF